MLSSNPSDQRQVDGTSHQQLARTLAGAKEQETTLPRASPQKQLTAADLNAYEDKLSPDVRATPKIDDTTYSPDYSIP